MMRLSHILAAIAIVVPAPILAQQGHDGHDMPAGEPVETKMPVIAESNDADPANAADAIWGVDAMRAARKALYHAHGDIPIFWFQGDRLETNVREGRDGYLWDVQGYYGNDMDKLWFKSEGEGNFGKEIENAELQALYSRAITPFVDLQTGIRQDLTGPARTYAVIGVQGLLPYIFEIDAAAFLSDRGDVTVRFEAEYDQRITQSLILQPRAEINFSAQDIPELAIGSGIDMVELGLRLRYAIRPEFAPYIGVEQGWKFGNSKDFAGANADDSSITNYIIGVRFWF